MSWKDKMLLKIMGNGVVLKVATQVQLPVNVKEKLGFVLRSKPLSSRQDSNWTPLTLGAMSCAVSPRGTLIS